MILLPRSILKISINCDKMKNGASCYISERPRAVIFFCTLCLSNGFPTPRMRNGPTVGPDRMMFLRMPNIAPFSRSLPFTVIQRFMDLIFFVDHFQTSCSSCEFNLMVPYKDELNVSSCFLELLICSLY